VDSVGALVPFVLIIGAFYLLIIRPSRNRQKAQQRLVDQLAVGARVMTTSGLYAEVAEINDDGVLLEVAPGVTMRWTKAAVARILPEPDAEDDAEDDAESDAESAIESDTDADDAALLEGTPEAPVSSSKTETDTADNALDADSTERPK
jgi:preprotein translocase subunit YajC